MRLVGRSRVALDRSNSFKLQQTSAFKPDSRKTRISPNAAMLRKLVRDRNCRPVLRGILESLLHYLTKELPKWTTRDRKTEKPAFDIGVERETDWPVQGIEASMKQARCSIVHLTGEHRITQGKMETSSKITEKCRSDPKKDQSAGDIIARRLTTFQLIQSKFTRCTPKPPVTQQREVGSLSSGRGVVANLNHCQDSEHDMHKKHHTRREHGLKRGGSVKNIIAKFAMTEQMEKGEDMLKKKPIKPRLIGRGILLSSLMERFETMAIVCRGSDLKCSHERPPVGAKVTSNIQQKVACHESLHQEVLDQTFSKQNLDKRIKSKPVGQQSNGNYSTNGEQHRPEQAVDNLIKVNSNLEENNDLKVEQIIEMGVQHSEQKAEGSLNYLKDGAHDNDVEGWRSEECAQSTEVEICNTNKLKYGHIEQLCLICVTESSLPEPGRLLPQVEAQVNWHVATITTCSPLWSTCLNSSPKKYDEEPSERSHMEKMHRHTALLHTFSESSKGASSTTAAEGRGPLKPQTEGLSTFTAPMENRAAADPKPTKTVKMHRSPQYVIPYRFDNQKDVDDQTDSSLQPQETVTPLVEMSPTHFNQCNETSINAGMGTMGPFKNIDPCLLNNMKTQTLQSLTKQQLRECEPQEIDVEAKEELLPVDVKDTSTPKGFRLSEDTATKTVIEDSGTYAVTLPKIQPERDNPTQRPKYTTVNYGDPLVKQTYKPKIIRFTDTFTF